MKLSIKTDRHKVIQLMRPPGEEFLQRSNNSEQDGGRVVVSSWEPALVDSGGLLVVHSLQIAEVFAGFCLFVLFVLSRGDKKGEVLRLDVNNVNNELRREVKKMVQI